MESGTRCALTVVPCGTGNDFSKTLGLTTLSPTEVADLATRQSPISIDVGVSDGHYFLNSCGFGFDAAVLEASNTVKYLKGDAVYIYSALRQVVGYPGVEVSPSGILGASSGRMLMVTVSNGRSLGGAFKIAPNASVLDGRLDVCFFADTNVVSRVRLFLGALRGTHLTRPEVFSATTERLALSFDAPPAMEIDGELRIARGKTVEISCVRGALSVIAAPNALP
jgi:diacylglycerol kinase (ATP)